MNKLHSLFKNVLEEEPPQHLESAILRQIEALENRSLRRKIIASYFSLAFSGVSTVWATLFFGESLLEAEFWSVSSLFFSDLGLVVQNWQAFLFSLLETLPLTRLITISVPLLALLISGRIFSYLNDKVNSSDFSQYNNKLTI